MHAYPVYIGNAYVNNRGLLFSIVLLAASDGSEWLILNLDIKKTATIACLPPLCFYALLAGSNTPVMRSLIMSIVVIVALWRQPGQNQSSATFRWRCSASLLGGRQTFLIFLPAHLRSGCVNCRHFSFSLTTFSFLQKKTERHPLSVPRPVSELAGCGPGGFRFGGLSHRALPPLLVQSDLAGRTRWLI